MGSIGHDCLVLGTLHIYVVDPTFAIKSVVKDTNYENEDIIMSDDEYDRMSQTSQTSMKGDEAFAKRKAGVQKNELNEQLKEYINQWREERQKEEGELKRLKEKQAK